MYSQKRLFGNVGEDLACKFLLESGFRILKRNYLKNFGELDIVAENSGTIHFVEVKTVSRETGKWAERTILDEYNPADNLTNIKIKRIIRTAEYFLLENGLELEKYQFDLVSVIIYDENMAKIEFIENINI